MAWRTGEALLLDLSHPGAFLDPLDAGGASVGNVQKLRTDGFGLWAAAAETCLSTNTIDGSLSSYEEHAARIVIASGLLRALTGKLPLEGKSTARGVLISESGGS